MKQLFLVLSILMMVFVLPSCKSSDNPVQPPPAGEETVTYAGQTYHVVHIGNQTWLKENLNVGTMIDSLIDQSDNGVVEKFCYGNNTENCNTYGALYQWREAMQYSTAEGAKGICPSGWHIPTKAEFDTLSAYVGGSNALKAIGQGTGAGAGTNTSGFSALLAGNKFNSPDKFQQIGNQSNIWSSKTFGTGIYVNMALQENNNSIEWYNNFSGFGFSVRCIKDGSSPVNNPPAVPSSPVPADNATNQDVSLNLSWTCSDPESSDILSYDLYLDIVSPPTNNVGSNLTVATMAQTGLANGETYYWKVVAKDNHGNSTPGPVWSFTTSAGVTTGIPCPGTPTVSYEGKTYHTVQIGSQCWLKENLDVGTRINGSGNQADNSTIEKFCYNDDPANCSTYGGLYQWGEAMQYSTTEGAQGICPPGWHIPTDSEFNLLDSHVGGDGNALKAIGQGTGSGAGTDTTGFSALLAGYLISQSDIRGFYRLGERAIMWSATQEVPYDRFMQLDDFYEVITHSSGRELDGNSVRCIKN